MNNTSKASSLERSENLEKNALVFASERQNILSGIERRNEIEFMQKRIIKQLGATKKNWNNWRWQMANRIIDLTTLQKCLDKGVPELFSRGIITSGKEFRWGISPYYLGLTDSAQKGKCPICLISLPTENELKVSGGDLDPMREEYTSPCSSITRRYPDRVIINCTNVCASYCRFCQRRRLIGKKDLPVSKQSILESIDYIKNNKGIRDVLITGGDPLTMEDDDLRWILDEISSIRHVEIIRIGTRVLVTMPQRITSSLCKVLKRYKTLYINTHFNHPAEVTTCSMNSASRLANSGIPLGNQTVLLAGVNNSHITLKYLFHLLLMMRIKPYYLFHPKKVRGTLHFYCRLSEGLEIVKRLRGFTSGMAVPTYVLNAPDGLGKVPLMAGYIKPLNQGEYMLTTWEGHEILYKEG